MGSHTVMRKLHHGICSNAVVNLTFFSYGIHIKERGFFTDSLIKVDTHTRRTNIWKPRTPHLPSEPVFVANPQGTCEDDGVLLTMALDANRKQSVLVVIDAKNMKEIARAE